MFGSVAAQGQRGITSKINRNHHQRSSQRNRSLEIPATTDDADDADGTDIGNTDFSAVQTLYHPQHQRRLDLGWSGSYSYSRDGSPKTAPSARAGQISR